MFRANYYGLEPVAGMIELEAEDKADFEYAADLELERRHPGIRDVSLSDVEEVIEA